LPSPWWSWGRLENGRETASTPKSIIPLKPITVIRDNIKKTIVADQVWSIAQICAAEFTAACAAAGLP
jgi:D-xylose transport system substrate-binding protein